MNHQSSPSCVVGPGFVAVVTTDPLGASMAGPAIRSVELARALARAGLEVRLCGPVVDALDVAGVEVWPVGEVASLPVAVDGASVIVVFAGTAAEHPWLFDTGAMVIVDSYDPELFETLERFRGAPINEQRAWVADAGRHQLEPLRRADAVMVATDRQRHFVLGQLAALGRLGSRVLAEDPRLERLVVTVPFGMPDEPPAAPTSAVSVRQGLVPDGAFVALWGGGLYDWLDPLTFVEALARCAEPVVGVFLAGPHPSPVVGHLPLVDRVRARAAELDLGERVIFVDRWVPYAERTRLATRSRRRRVPAPVPCRDRVRLPDPHPRLPVGLTPGGLHRGRRPRRADRRERRSGRWCRRATSTPLPRHSTPSPSRPRRCTTLARGESPSALRRCGGRRSRRRWWACAGDQASPPTVGCPPPVRVGIEPHCRESRPGLVR